MGKLNQHKNFITFCRLTRQTCSIGFIFFFLFQTICKTRNKDYLVIKREINVYMDKNAHSFNYMHFILN